MAGDSSETRLRILVSAFSCSPYEGSESGIGWNVVGCLRKYHDVTVLVGDVSDKLRAKSHLERYFSTNPHLDGVQFIYVAPDYPTRLLERIHRCPGLWPVYYLAYRKWQSKAYLVASQMHKESPFDVAHEFTIQSARTPGFLWKLRVPFVWGPVSGAPVLPLSFYGMFGFRGGFRPVTRDLLNRLQARVSRHIPRVARRAAKVFVATPEDKAHAERVWKIEAELLPAAGTSPSSHARVRMREKNEPLRIVWSGLMVPRKALPILLRALAGVSGLEMKWSLDILGDGPMRSQWQKDAEILKNSSSRITWHGRLPIAEAHEKMAQGDVLVHTALTEGTPNVVLEALSFGLPVVCHNACGMGVVVDELCGIRIPLDSPTCSITGFRSALERLISDVGLLATLSEGSLRRSKILSWDYIACRIADSYTDLCKR